MTLPDGFFEVHRDLDREGPGLPADVHWALDRTGLAGAVRVCDAACGPGADTVTLARALPAAQIDAVDMIPHFVTVAQSRVAQFGERVQVRQGDMANLTGPYDLIWCAGALYFLGLAEGLKCWRSALAPGGWVAFSEPCLLRTPPSGAVTRFWAGEGQIGDLDGIRARVAAAGYRIGPTRMIVGDAWAAYYTPMEARIAALKAAGRGDALRSAIADSETEIANWRAASDEIAYALILAQPV